MHFIGYFITPAILVFAIAVYSLIRLFIEEVR